MITRTAPDASARIGGSFRDPSGYVFQRQQRIFRAIDDACHQTLRDLQDSGLLDALMTERLLARTRFVEDRDECLELSCAHAGYEHFLEHEVIAPITYPYEWSLSMLADAALLTLELQERLAGAGFALKDATAYNVQFVHGRPRFIDLASIEKPVRHDIWYALGQFTRMFTIPLMLACYHGRDLKSCFLANIDGVDAEQFARGLGWLERCRPRYLLDVTLPLWLGRKATQERTRGREMVERQRLDSGAQIFNLRRLRRKVHQLASSYRPAGTWSDYTSSCSYSSQAENAKKAFVREFLSAHQPAAVLDAGCNTGDYSYIAAECGARVLAADGAHDAVELLYRRLREQPADITPIVLDLTNPSPAIGFCNRERASFLERLDVDCVQALALLHHLLVSANLSLAAVRDFFADLTKEFLVLEFVPTHDVMFEQLLRFRRHDFADLDLQRCKAVFGQRFELLGERALPGSPRTLLFLRKRR